MLLRSPWTMPRRLYKCTVLCAVPHGVIPPLVILPPIAHDRWSRPRLVFQHVAWLRLSRMLQLYMRTVCAASVREEVGEVLLPLHRAVGAMVCSGPQCTHATNTLSRSTGNARTRIWINYCLPSSSRARDASCALERATHERQTTHSYTATVFVTLPRTRVEGPMKTARPAHTRKSASRMPAMKALSGMALRSWTKLDWTPERSASARARCRSACAVWGSMYEMLLEMQRPLGVLGVEVWCIHCTHPVRQDWLAIIGRQHGTSNRDRVDDLHKAASLARVTFTFWPSAITALSPARHCWRQQGLH